MATITAPLSTFNSTVSPTANAREWWALEARRCGSDWVSIGETVSTILFQLAAATACRTCGAWPCINPPFCASCRAADGRKARPRYAPTRPAPPPIADFPKADLGSKNWKEIAAEAWSSPSWKQAALEYHYQRGSYTLIVEIPPEGLARLRRLMSDSVSLDAAWAELNDSRNRPAPKATIEAVMYAVRERGLAALKEPTTAGRLERCDAAARAEIEQRIANLRKD